MRAVGTTARPTTPKPGDDVATFPNCTSEKAFPEQDRSPSERPKKKKTHGRFYHDSIQNGHFLGEGGEAEPPASPDFSRNREEGEGAAGTGKG